MKPYLIDRVVNNTGDQVDETAPEVYKRLMTKNEAVMLGELMKDVVEYGTASALSGQGYTAAGKTGSPNMMKTAPVIPGLSDIPMWMIRILRLQ